jgi:hypothetical protein
VNDNMEERLQAVERLLKVFRLERITYLTVTGLALVMMLSAAVQMMLEKQLSPSTLGLLFGSSGLISYSIGRVLKMWDQAIAMVTGQVEGGRRHG